MSPVTVRQTPLTQMESPTRASSAYHGAADMDTGEIAEVLYRLDLAEVLHDAVNNRVLLRSGSGGRGRWPLPAVPSHATMPTPPGTADVDRPRRVAAPIPDFNRRSGVPPGQPAAVAAGGRGLSRTVRSFNRPRSTLLSPTSVPQKIFRAVPPWGPQPDRRVSGAHLCSSRQGGDLVGLGEGRVVEHRVEPGSRPFAAAAHHGLCRYESVAVAPRAEHVDAEELAVFWRDEQLEHA